MKKLPYLLLVTITAAAWLVSCGEDCPTCPPVDSQNHYSGLAYLSMSSGFYGFYVYDTDSARVVDSVTFESTVLVESVSPDGRYLVAWYQGDGDVVARVYDAATMKLLQVLPSVAQSAFADDGRILIGKRGRALYKYGVPGFSLVSVDSLLESSTDLMICDRIRSVFAVDNWYQLLQISYDSMQVVRRWVPHDANGDSIFIQHSHVSPDGGLLYILGGISDLRVFVYDLVGDSIIGSYAMYGPWGDIRVHSNGREFWVTDPGRVEIPFRPPDAGTIFIFDAATGAYKGGISLYGYVPDHPQIPLDATRITFTPDGREAFVCTGVIGPRQYPGTVLRIDCQRRKVTDVIFPDIGRGPYSAVVAPRP